MRTPLRRVCIPAGIVALLLTACGGDDSSTPTTGVSIGSPATVVATSVATSTASGATTAVPTIAPYVDDTTDIPLPPPPGTGDIPVAPPATSDSPVYISVTVGVDDSSSRIESVPLGSTVTIDALNEEGSDEFRLQGYELGGGQVMGPGETETITFVANQAGDFAFESVTSGTTLLTLHVA